MLCLATLVSLHTGNRARAETTDESAIAYQQLAPGQDCEPFRSVKSTYESDRYSGKNSAALKRNRNTAAEPSHSQSPKCHNARFSNL